MENASLQHSLSFNISTYFSLSKTHRDLIRYLFHMEKRKKDDEWQEIYPKITRMALKTGCSIRTVQRFNKKMRDLGGIIFEVGTRFRENKSQSTNTYKMDKNFLKSLIWLDQRNLLRSERDGFVKIIIESQAYEEQQVIKMSPPPKPKCHPYSLTPLIPAPKNKEYSCGEYIHPLIQEVGKISVEQKIILSKYPVQAIYEATKDCYWFSQQLGNKVKSPYDLLLAQIQRRTGVRPERR